jgi:hypothetical protein
MRVPKDIIPPVNVVPRTGVGDDFIQGSRSVSLDDITDGVHFLGVEGEDALVMKRSNNETGALFVRRGRETIKYVAKGPVSHVMQQPGTLTEKNFLVVTPKVFRQSSCKVHHPNTVLKACMGCGGVDPRGRPELFDLAQTLELRGINTVDNGGGERNRTMNVIINYFIHTVLINALIGLYGFVDQSSESVSETS